VIYWVAGTLLSYTLVASGPLGISRFQHVSHEHQDRCASPQAIRSRLFGHSTLTEWIQRRTTQ